MSGKLLEEIRRADRNIERMDRNPPDRGPEGPVGEGYPLARVKVGYLAEPAPAGFQTGTTVQHFPGARNPVILLASADHNGLPAIDVLEALLYVTAPGARCREIAEQAIQAFGSVGAVLSASVRALITRLEVSEQIAYGLKAIHGGMCSVLREPVRERIEINSLTALTDYLGLSLKYEAVEVLRVLYLDGKNGLISDEEAGRGTVDHVPLYPREIVRRALELGASAVILVHNHPSGDLKPSKADVIFSQQVQCALSVMEIPLHDSLIVGRNGFASLRSSRKLSRRRGGRARRSPGVVAQ